MIQRLPRPPSPRTLLPIAITTTHPPKDRFVVAITSYGVRCSKSFAGPGGGAPPLRAPPPSKTKTSMRRARGSVQPLLRGPVFLPAKTRADPAAAAAAAAAESEGFSCHSRHGAQRRRSSVRHWFASGSKRESEWGGAGTTKSANIVVDDGVGEGHGRGSWSGAEGWLSGEGEGGGGAAAVQHGGANEAALSPSG